MFMVNTITIRGKMHNAKVWRCRYSNGLWLVYESSFGVSIDTPTFCPQPELMLWLRLYLETDGHTEGDRRNK